MSKKIIFKSKRGIKLVGILENEKASKCVILVHGFLVDKDSRGVFLEVSKELQKIGFAVFRFDFGGHGESEIAEISMKGESQDLESAMNLMKKKYSRIGLLGHSLGGIISLKEANNSDVIICWAPATMSGTSKSLDDLEKKIQENNFVIKKYGKKYVIANDYPKERLSINQKKLVGNVKIPLLIIHGSEDSIISVNQTFNAEKYIKNGKIKILQGEDHNFKDKLNEAIIISVDWMKNYL